MLCHFKVRRKKFRIYRCHPVYDECESAALRSDAMRYYTMNVSALQCDAILYDEWVNVKALRCDAMTSAHICNV